VILDGIGLKLDNALDIARAIGRNTIQKLDLGFETKRNKKNQAFRYNRIPAEGIVAIGRAMATNTSITELKLHRQESDYGTPAEEELVNSSLLSSLTSLTSLLFSLFSSFSSLLLFLFLLSFLSPLLLLTFVNLGQTVADQHHFDSPLRHPPLTNLRQREHQG